MLEQAVAGNPSIWDNMSKVVFLYLRGKGRVLMG